MVEIQPIVMPKWGLAMQEGMLAAWHVAEGQEVTKGQEIADIETSKIANALESPVAGPLRRRLVGEGETVPVGMLLAVVADAAIADDAIEAFVADFQAEFAASAAEAVADTGPEPEFVEAGRRRLRYLKMGEAGGVPVLFIHGFGGDLNNWLFNQPALAETHTTYALDLPGHGGSSKAVVSGDGRGDDRGGLRLHDRHGPRQGPPRRPLAGRCDQPRPGPQPSGTRGFRHRHPRPPWAPRSRWSTSTASSAPAVPASSRRYSKCWSATPPW